MTAKDRKEVAVAIAQFINDTGKVTMKHSCHTLSELGMEIDRGEVKAVLYGSTSPHGNGRIDVKILRGSEIMFEAHGDMFIDNLAISKDIEPGVWESKIGLPDDLRELLRRSRK